jgi:hypothetical protein
MRVSWKLKSGAGIDGIVQAIQESSPNATIDIHVECGVINVEYLDNLGYAPIYRTSRDHLEGKYGMEGFVAPIPPLVGGKIAPECAKQFSPVMGCQCPTCVEARIRRGF